LEVAKKEEGADQIKTQIQSPLHEEGVTEKVV
jgi:hypothetical protein